MLCITHAPHRKRDGALGHEHRAAGRRGRAGALRHRNVDGADEVFAPDLIDHNPAAEAASGIDGMRASIAAVRDGFTDTQHRILFQQELPGGWVVLHWRMTGTHTGDAFGFPASGNPVDINGQDIMRIVDRKITEIYHVEELLKLTQQISGGAQSA
ncbi:ester cyclase [Streptomyces africanus]|uniref:ester cyclase n=1 Tax=Streptomyces africanus TaxID=231024 RepID=UPI0027D88C93|nr:ester cyclase [Streptomyces africanus]